MIIGASDADEIGRDRSLANQMRHGRSIDAQTALYAVLGDPVAHSLSPVMHNAAFAQLGYNGVYVAARVTDPAGAVAGIRALGMAGASVTIPHKRTVIEYLDRLDPAAEAIGAVNTIVNQNGVLIGYNTDGTGAVRALTGVTSLASKRVTILGAGGAARAIGYALSQNGAHVTIANRSHSRGEALARDLRVAFQPLETFNGDECDLVINTTPVGMVPDTDVMPIDAGTLHPGMVVMDAIYNPLVTRFLRAADQIGCVTVNGLDMFVCQGTAQFELWTNMMAPVETMRAAVLTALQ